MIRIQPEKPITTLLIDLDETVYPSSSGIWPIFRQRLDLYLRDYLGFAPEIIPELRNRLYNTYGTTLRGLQIEYAVDAEEYLEFVHDAPLEDYLNFDHALVQTLAMYPQPKYIFTNASQKHAERILELMGLETLFSGIIDVQAIAPYCKPNREAFQIAMALIGETDPARYLFIDDTSSNLVTAREMGMHVVLVGENILDGIPTISKLADLPQIFPV